ncbi:MAG: glycosyltransferase family 4 protein [Thermoplasmata archaeon]|nr:MAG: glycosyltransferase family 4 protein [Thermoplasmata archaeon]
MKILQACTRFPPAPGGAESHVFHISKELLSRNHDLKVYTTDLYMEIPFTHMKEWSPKVDGIPVKRFKAYSLHGNMHYVFVPKMTRAILKANVDIIHAHSYGYFQVNAGAFNRRLRTVPFILTPHYHPQWSMWGGEKRKKIRRFYDRVFAQSVIQSVDIIIGVSHHEIELMHDAIDFDMDRVRYIPNGIDFTKFEPIPSPEHFRKKYNLKGPFILYVGRLASNKGLMVLVKAAAKVLKTHPDIKFVLIGEDEGMKVKLKAELKSLGILKNFLFTGHITDEQIFLSAFSACELLTLPSEYEAFGIVLLEAMACEKPCVATRVGGVPEALGKEGKTGLLVEYGDSEGLAEAINDLLSNPFKRRQFGKAGRKHVKEKFTWPSIVTEIEKVYNELKNSNI